jgi:putative ABC transport system permease protein
MEAGHAHDEDHYIVKGIFGPTNSILDDLILTNVESVWEMHHVSGIEREIERVPSESQSILVPSVMSGDSLKEITSVLVKYRSPLAAVQLPRLINSQTSLQAASPAFEMARLFSILGVGADIIRGFAYLLIAISALSIFIALYNSLKERRYDMAVMRSMGASRTKLLVSILIEGGLLTLLGSCIGLGMGHGALALLPKILTQFEKAGIDAFTFYPEEWIILGASLLLGLICASIPAGQAYRSDISKVLSGN